MYWCWQVKERHNVDQYIFSKENREQVQCVSCQEFVDSTSSATLFREIDLLFVKLRYVLSGITLVLLDRNINCNHIKEHRK